MVFYSVTDASNAFNQKEQIRYLSCLRWYGFVV